MEGFIDDMIHMTEEEKLIYYWPLWLSLVVACALLLIILQKRKK